jgi:hypothetical protein
MANPVYSTVLFEEHALPTAGVSFTNPTDETWLIRMISVFYPGAGVASGCQLVNLDNSATIFFDTVGVIVAGHFEFFTYLHLVIPPGFNGNWSSLGAADVAAYGYALIP